MLDGETNKSFSGIEFKKITLSDKAIFEPYLAASANISCELSFGNLFAWSGVEDIRWALFEGALLIRNKDGFYFPLAPEGGAAAAERALRMIAEAGEPLVSLTAGQAGEAAALAPGYIFANDRDRSEYVYDAAALREYPGKGLHAKRNHLNRFIALYGERSSFEPIGRKNIEECRQFGREWAKVNSYYLGGTLAADLGITEIFLDNFEALGLVGLCARVDGSVKGYTVGERAYPGSDAVVVHVEKASYDVEGIYPALAAMFLRANPGFARVNREDDLGDEGLRRSKLSYKPEFLLEKFTGRKARGMRTGDS